MIDLAGYVVSGIILGSQYALFAVGLALLLGVVRVFNLGHGALFVVGGYASWFVIGAFGVTSVWLLLLAAAVGGAAAGAVLDVGVLRPMRRRHADHFIEAFGTVGFAMVVIGVLELLVGGEPRGLHIERAVVARIGAGTITNTGLISVVVAVALMILTAVMLRRTRTGLAFRAAADSMADLEIWGYRGTRVLAVAIIYSSVMAAVAGGLVATHLGGITPDLGERLMVKGIALVIVGGMGSVWGAVAAGFVVGIGEAVTVGMISSGWREIVAMGLLLVILLLRPQGLAGRDENLRF